jgi:ABC-type glycerol-3-phosphate transport system substrate-binding protein
VCAPVVAACSGGTSGGPVTINLYTNPDSSGAILQAANSCSAQSGGKYKIQWSQLPKGSDDQRQQFVRRLAAHDSGMDVLAMDVTWEPEFAQAGWIRPWAGAQAQQASDGELAGPLKTATWNGQLIAAPWSTNTELLWYRSDLVPNPPQTWSQMIQMADALAKQGKPHFIETQGAQYEGLTVWFNTLVASAGGSILNAKGTGPSLGPPALQALQTMTDLAHSPAADPSLSNDKEDDGRLAMESGTAAFELNYPFVYPSMKENKPDLFKNFKWALYPGVDPNRPAQVTLGGLDLAVSTYSKHPAESFAAALCLQSRPNQENIAIKAGFPPTLRAIYTSPTPNFTQEYPFYKDILAALDTAAVRPQTPAYQNISIVTSHTLSPPGGVKPAKALKTLDSQVSDALQSKGLIP